MPQDPSTMTVRQLDRRARVIAAVQDLVAERGVVELQVKDIADRAEVSLAAIYRYFSSKEHMLAEALREWADRLTARRRPPALESRDAFATLVTRGVAAYRRSPRFAELFLEVAASRDPHAIASFGAMGDVISSAMYGSLPPLDPDLADQIVHIVGNAWLGGLFDCVHGRSEFIDLERSLETACHLLLAACATGVASG
ncbi:MAG: TetR family transcriptional regulator [Acidimicrobiales bacterium]